MTERRSRLGKDISAVVAACEACDFVEVTEAGGESITLLFKAPKDVNEYTFNFSEDYPDGTAICSSADANFLQSRLDPLPAIFAEMCHEWSTKHGLPVPHLSFTPEPQSVAGQDQKMEVVPSPQLQPTQTLDTQVSVASSEYTEASEGDYEDYDPYDDYDMFDAAEPEEVTMHSLLETETTRVQEMFGANAVEYRLHAGIDEMDVFLFIDLNNFLDEHTASAWGLKLSEPLAILLHIRTVSKYLDGLEPQVDVFQVSPANKAERTKVGIGIQMKKIMQTFVSQQWKSLSNSKVEDLLERSTKSHPKEAVASPAPDPDSKLAQLVEMGFNTKSAQEALKATYYDLEKAIAMLAQQSVDCAGVVVAGGDNGVKSPFPVPPKQDVKLDVPAKVPELARQQSLGAQLQLESGNENDPQADKEPPSLENGFLVQCMSYALNRMRSLSEFCVICDERHVLEVGLLKPCVCTRELCVFAFQTLGVMADAAEAIATDADVVDLLIAMANAAAHSPRANLILDPYPSIVDPNNSVSLAMDPKKKDFDQVKVVMKEVVMSRENLLKGRAVNMKKELDEHNKLAFPLMQWIIATCRAHIVLLPHERQMQSVKTKYQFLLISSPPSKEVLFRDAKDKHGSTFAFHGSNIENWHSIMRKGLINASGTKFQMHGAAYGSGIYLSPCSSTSFGYTGYYGSIAKPADRKEGLAGKMNLRCLALCEVVTSKDLRRNGNIWVCPNSDHVCTRFFFVYDENSVSAGNLDTRKTDFQKEIQHAVGHIRAFRR